MPTAKEILDRGLLIQPGGELKKEVERESIRRRRAREAELFPSEPTQQALDNRTQAVENLDAGRPQDFGIDEPITSDTLRSTQTTDFETAGDIPIFPVGAIQTPLLQETASEREAQDFTTQLQGLNEQLLGQSEFRTGLEEEAGIPELTQTQQDLQSRFGTLQRESLALPLQLQQEAEGRGITKGGLAPLQTARLRTNAIQALGVASLLEASRGNISSALDLIDRKVEQKFAPIKEQIAVKERNLQLILQSPQFSREQKNEAQKQADDIANQKAVIDGEADNDRQIGEIAIQAIQAGADAITVRNIQNARTADEAQAMLADITAPQIQAGAEAQAEQQTLENERADRALDIQAAKLGIDREKLDLERAKIQATTDDESTVKAEELTQATDKAKTVQRLILKLRSDTALLESATGASGIASRHIQGTDAFEFNRTHSQLKALLQLDGLQALRGLGSMSEKEFQAAADSQTALDVGLSSEAYLRELNIIEQNLLGTFTTALETGETALVDTATGFGFDETDIDEIDEILLFGSPDSAFTLPNIASFFNQQ